MILHSHRLMMSCCSMSSDSSLLTGSPSSSTPYFCTRCMPTFVTFFPKESGIVDIATL